MAAPPPSAPPGAGSSMGQAGGSKKQDRRDHGRGLTRIGSALALAMLAGGLTLPLTSELLSYALPDETRAELGDAVVRSLPQQQFCRDEAGLAALDEMVEALAEAASVDADDFHVYVVQTDQINAVAGPGGRVVMFSSIIEQADGPGEVAAVLAHEMAHVLERHPETGVVDFLGSGVLSLLNPGAERFGASVAEQLISQKNSRDDELDADRVGVQLLNAAGFDSRGAISFFEKMRAMSERSDGGLDLLSTHPSGSARIEALKRVVADGKPVLDQAHWTALQGVCSETGSPRATGE